MTPRVDRRLVLACALAPPLFSACAGNPRHAAPPAKKSTDTQSVTASGKMSVGVATEPTQQFSAAFEFEGSLLGGELRFYSPFATRLATLRWRADRAHWEAGGEQRSFDSLSEASAHALGVALPVEAMLSWLARRDQAAPGWETDFSLISSGRIRAQRLTPLPAVDLRIILDPP